LRTELRFKVPLDTEYVISETLFPANLWKLNLTQKTTIHQEHKDTTTGNKSKM